MVGSGTFEVDAVNSEYFFPYFTEERWVSIAHHIFRHSMKLEDVIQIRLSHSESRVRVRQSDEVSVLAQTVDNH